MNLPLFVYGTLAPNRSNHHIMTPIANGSWTTAHIYGDLLPNGWGAALGYPAVIPKANSTQRVDGFLFESDELIHHWQRLDEFEGDGYDRVVVDVHLQTGQICQAYVYALSANELASFTKTQADKSATYHQ